LLSLAQDKATMEMEAMDDGFVAKILKPDGAQNVVVGEPVMIVVEDAADVAAFAGYTGGDAPAAAPKAAAAAPKAAPAPPPPPRAAAPAAPAAPAAQWSAPASGSRVVASPLAKKNAAAAGLPLAGLAGTGPGGRVLAADVADALQARAHAPAGAGATAAAPASAGPSALDAFFPAYTDASVSNIRKITAQRLQESKQTVPHFYLSVDVSMDALLKARAALNGAPGAAHKISVNDLMIKAAALACARVPDVNASWLGDRIRRYSAVDVSVAVQTDAGLMVPIVRGADTKGLAAISADVKALAAKARAGKLTPAEFVGGTFTISNLGVRAPRIGYRSLLAC
jgi:pyruvate dehydrogenase E2 component (dihydrolipoamide acetyltransferase)